MIFIYLILIINYLLAYNIIKIIMNDENWAKFLYYISLEQNEYSKLIIDNQLLYRQIFVTLLFLPFIAIVIWFISNK